MRVMRRIRDQQQVREILLKVGPNEAGEVEVAEEVAVHGEERPLAEQGKRQGNSAGGFERFGLARGAERDAGTAPIPGRGFDYMPQGRLVDHDTANSRSRPPLGPPDDPSFAAPFAGP